MLQHSDSQRFLTTKQDLTNVSARYIPDKPICPLRAFEAEASFDKEKIATAGLVRGLMGLARLPDGDRNEAEAAVDQPEMRNTGPKG